MEEQVLDHREEYSDIATFSRKSLAATLQRLREQENFLLAIVAGVLAALTGAAIWTGVTIVTGYKIGYIAIAVGFIVALAIRFAGKGLGSKFQLLGAILAFLGCAIGNFFTLCYFIAENEGLGFFQVLTLIDLAAIPELMISTFSGMDLLFYGIAIYEGYRLSLRQLSEPELAALHLGNTSTEGA